MKPRVNMPSEIADIIVIDSDEDADIKPQPLQLPQNSQIIVIQPDSDMESTPELQTKNIKMNTDEKPGSEGTDDEEVNKFFQNNRKNVNKLVDFLLALAKAKRKAPRAKPCDSTEEEYESVKEKDSNTTSPAVDCPSTKPEKPCSELAAACEEEQPGTAGDDGSEASAETDKCKYIFYGRGYSQRRLASTKNRVKY